MAPPSRPAYRTLRDLYGKSIGARSRDLRGQSMQDFADLSDGEQRFVLAQIGYFQVKATAELKASIDRLIELQEGQPEEDAEEVEESSDGTAPEPDGDSEIDEAAEQNAILAEQLHRAPARPKAPPTAKAAPARPKAPPVPATVIDVDGEEIVPA